MAEKMREDGSSPDPITFDDEIIWGLDPAVHWVNNRFQREQFPEIVPHIFKNWNNEAWLTRLVERLGYNTAEYDPDTNQKTIYANSYVRRRYGLDPMRFFLLRAAGVSNEIITQIFIISDQQHFPGGVYEDMKKRRRELANTTKKKKKK